MSKYHNEITYVDGIKFDSGKEASYYAYLKSLEKDGKISDLRLQVKYELLPPVKRMRTKTKQLKTKLKVWEEEYTAQQPVYYLADFVYIDNATGKEEVVDVKSAITRKHPVYVLKKKMMFALKGIEIIEV